MLKVPMDVLKVHPIRKTKAQKKAFQTDMLSYAKDLGYDCHLEKGVFGLRNIVIGDPKTAKYLVTAHYDTPASIGLPNIITPCSFLGCIIYMLAVGLVASCGFNLVATIANFFLRDPALSEDIGAAFLFVIIFLLLAGPANRNNANDNTSGVITVLETARTLHWEHRNKVCFVLFDMEEQGVIGSAAYRWNHRKETNKQTVMNLDSVGDGDHILLLPFKMAAKDQDHLKKLNRISGEFGRKHLLVKHKGFRFYPSDQVNFPKAVAISAFHQRRIVGYYCDKIHTKRDTVLDETNVNILRAALTTFICCDS